MKKKLNNLIVVLIIAAIATLLVRVAYWNELVGIILITLSLIGIMFIGVNIAIKLIEDGDLKIKERSNAK